MAQTVILVGINSKHNPYTRRGIRERHGEEVELLCFAGAVAGLLESHPAQQLNRYASGTYASTALDAGLQ